MSRFKIKLHLRNLTYIKCAAPLVKYKISLEIAKMDGRINMSAALTESTTDEIHLPLKDKEPPENV